MHGALNLKLNSGVVTDKERWEVSALVLKWKQVTKYCTQIKWYKMEHYIPLRNSCASFVAWATYGIFHMNSPL